MLSGILQNARWCAVMLLAACLQSICPSSSAQDAKASPQKFDIARFDVQGNTLLPGAEIERIVAPFTGAARDFAVLQAALAALEAAYRDRGYGAVQVTLPEQDITTGTVRVRVLEPRVDRVQIEGNKHFDADNISRSLPSLRPGATPNSNEIARNLAVLNEHAIKQTTVLLRAGASEDRVDVNVRVKDDKPWRVVLTLDDTGTSETGYWRSGIGFQHTNLFNRDHALNAQYVTSPTRPSKVSIYGLGYHIPFYGLSSSLDLFAGYSDVNSGTVQGLFTVAGKGTVLGTRWNYQLPTWDQLEHKLTFGLDYRAFKTDVAFGEQGGLVPDITVHPVSVTYAGVLRTAISQFNYYASASANIPGGSDGSSVDFERSRLGAANNYKIFRYGFSYVRSTLNDWQARAVFNGQYTRDLLVTGEQFGLGGPDSVRGYLLREVINDRGFFGQLEVHTPDVARRMKFPDDYRVRFLAFYDYGDVTRNNPLPGEQSGKSIASAGIGMRMYHGRNVSLRVDIAQILRAAGTRQASDQRINGAIAVSF